MSSVVNIATVAVASKHAQMQMAVAAKFAKSNATTEQSVVQLIEAANTNMQQVVQSAASSGIGATLDITI